MTVRFFLLFFLLLRQPLSILIVLWDVLVTVDLKICAGDAEEALLAIALLLLFWPEGAVPYLRQTVTHL